MADDWYTRWREELAKDPNHVVPPDEEWWQEWTRKANEAPDIVFEEEDGEQP